MSKESDLDTLEAALRAGLERSGVGASVRWDGKAVGGPQDVEWLAAQWLIQWLGWDRLDRWPRSGPPAPMSPRERQS